VKKLEKNGVRKGQRNQMTKAEGRGCYQPSAPEAASLDLLVQAPTPFRATMGW